MTKKKKLPISPLKKAVVTEALAFKLLASLERLVNHDTYETEYDGQMLTYCHDCGWLEHKTHSATCAYIEAKNLVEEAYTTPTAQPVQPIIDANDIELDPEKKKAIEKAFTIWEINLCLDVLKQSNATTRNPLK